MLDYQPTKEEIINTLAYMIGTENYYSYKTLFISVNLTDGVKYLCESCKCYWLIDIVLSYQLSKKVKRESFQTWTLSRIEDNNFQIVATDGNETTLARQDIPFSDFPLDTIKLFFINGVIMLTSEY